MPVEGEIGSATCCLPRYSGTKIEGLNFQCGSRSGQPLTRRIPRACVDNRMRNRTSRCDDRRWRARAEHAAPWTRTAATTDHGAPDHLPELREQAVGPVLRARAAAGLPDAERSLYGHHAEPACPAPDFPSTIWAVNDEGRRADLDSAAQHVFAAMLSATSEPRRRVRAEQSLPRFEACLPRRAHRSCLSGGLPAARKLLIAGEALRPAWPCH
jgi:hypothetical protein